MEIYEGWVEGSKWCVVNRPYGRKKILLTSITL